MKKYKFIVLFFAGISVLFVLFNFLIFSSFISINKSNFREEAIRKHNSGLIQLPMAKLQLYKNAPGIEWKDENKELVIMGQYYEVLSITTTKSGVLVTLIADTEESGLFKKYFSYAKKQHRQLADVAGFFIQLTYLESNSQPKIKLAAKSITVKFKETALTGFNYIPKYIKPPSA